MNLGREPNVHHSACGRAQLSKENLEGARETEREREREREREWSCYQAESSTAMVETETLHLSITGRQRMHWCNDCAIILSTRSGFSKCLVWNPKRGNFTSHMSEHWCNPKQLSEKRKNHEWCLIYCCCHHFWRIFRQQDRIAGEHQHDAPKFTVQLWFSEFTEFHQICMFICFMNFEFVRNLHTFPWCTKHSQKRHENSDLTFRRSVMMDIQPSNPGGVLDLLRNKSQGHVWLVSLVSISSMKRLRSCNGHPKNETCHSSAPKFQQDITWLYIYMCVWV